MSGASDEDLGEDEIAEEVEEIIEFFETLPLASPADLDRLDSRLKRDDELRDLLRAIRSPRSFAIACQVC